MKVFVRAAAREDILRQFRYYLVEQEAALAAQRFLDAVEEAIETISLNPEIGAPKLFENPKLAGLRSWPVRGFPSMRVYYIHSAAELRIVRVLHGKRDIAFLLEDEAPEEP